MSAEWIVAAALGTGGLLVGVLAGWAIGHRRGSSRGHRDWKTRIAARDTDLNATRDALTEATEQIDELRTELRQTKVRLARTETAMAEPAADGTTTEASPEVEALARELDEAEEEVARLRAAAAEPHGDPELRRRIEELESELATLESLRCRDPEAHRREESGSRTVAGWADFA